jgi:hypothetical protein
VPLLGRPRGNALSLERLTGLTPFRSDILTKTRGPVIFWIKFGSKPFCLLSLVCFQSALKTAAGVKLMHRKQTMPYCGRVSSDGRMRQPEYCANSLLAIGSSQPNYLLERFHERFAN